MLTERLSSVENPEEEIKSMQALDDRRPDPGHSESQGPRAHGRLLLAHEGADEEPECQLAYAVHAAGLSPFIPCPIMILLTNGLAGCHRSKRKWIPRNQRAAPTTIAALHEQVRVASLHRQP